MYTQWQDDKEYGDKISGERGRVFGIGPQVVWNFIDHGGLVFKWQHETHVRNRPKGNRYWIEFAAPISTLFFKDIGPVLRHQALLNIHDSTRS